MPEISKLCTTPDIQLSLTSIDKDHDEEVKKWRYKRRARIREGNAHPYQ